MKNTKRISNGYRNMVFSREAKGLSHTYYSIQHLIARGLCLLYHEEVSKKDACILFRGDEVECYRR